MGLWMVEGIHEAPATHPGQEGVGKVHAVVAEALQEQGLLPVPFAVVVHGLVDVSAVQGQRVLDRQPRLMGPEADRRLVRAIAAVQLLPRGVLDVAGIRVVAAEVEGRDRDDPRIGGRVRPSWPLTSGRKTSRSLSAMSARNLSGSLFACRI